MAKTYAEKAAGSGREAVLKKVIYIRISLLNIYWGDVIMDLNPNNALYNDFYAAADLSKYAGEWVAIVSNKVVAHGKNVKFLMEKVKEKYPSVTPFIAKVPLKEILIW